MSTDSITRNGSRKEVSPFGRKLKELRLRRGMSQATLARRAGVSNGYVGLIEIGDRGDRPSLDIVKRFGQAVSATVEEMEELLRATSHLGPHERLVPDERQSFAQFVDSDGMLSRHQKDVLIAVYDSWMH